MKQVRVWISTIITMLITMKICTVLLQHVEGWQAWVLSAAVVVYAAEFATNRWEEEARTHQ